MSEPIIKVTHIKNRYHARCRIDGKIVDEMTCSNKQDIGVICREILRWQDKMGGNKYTSWSRSRQDPKLRKPIGRVWYQRHLQEER